MKDSKRENTIIKITNINYDSCNYFLKVDSIDYSQENSALTRLESYAVSELMYHKKKEKFIKEASILFCIILIVMIHV